MGALSNKPLTTATGAHPLVTEAPWRLPPLGPRPAPPPRRGESRLAEFRDPGNVYDGMPLVPPFYFAGVTARVFPLRASLRALQQFCDSFLNILPEELGRFRPSLPYVYLMMLDYGRMASRAANMGWLSQHEVMFSVPLEWYRVVCGRWVFKDWAWTSPFMYVDKEVSMTLGRTVYGWPKVLITACDDAMEWVRTPSSRVQVAKISAPVFGRAYAGLAEEDLVFLEVEREPSHSLFRVPPDFRGPLSPWMAAPNAAHGAAGFARDYMLSMRHQGGVPPHPVDRIANLARMSRVAAAGVAPVAPDLHFNTINLKQFRDVSSPENYCYQAITNTRMDVAAFNRGGPLGELSLFALDPSGGYTIKLYRWPSLPIIETLGIEVTRQRRDGDVQVAELEPVMPFWYDVDMGYNLGETLAWRICDARWRGPLGACREPPGGVVRPLDRRFNSLLGATAQTIPGPFYFAPSTVRVLPLLARASQLQEGFLDRFLNEALEGRGGRFRLDLWGGNERDEAYVFMAVSSCENKASATNNIGSWREYEMSFFVPVSLNEKVGGAYVCRGVGLVPAFNLVNNTTAAISSAEVVGIPTTRTRFDRPSDKWMDDNGPSATLRQELLKVSAEVLTVLGEGQATEERLLVEVAANEGDLPPIHVFDNDVRREAVRRAWAARVSDVGADEDSPDASIARALAAQVMVGVEPLSIFSLKQFRDVGDPDHACYQSLTRIHRFIQSGLDVQAIDDDVHVRIHSYPTLPIVERLGLIPKDTFLAAGGLVHTLEAIKPFWLRAPMIERLGETLCERGGAEPWQDPCVDTGLSFFFSGDLDRRLDVGPGLDVEILRAAPRFLESILRAATAEGAPTCTLKEAKDAVQAVSPFEIIQSILDGEWEDHSGDTRWESESRTIDDEVRVAVDGAAPVDQPRVALAVLKRRFDGLEPVGDQTRVKVLLSQDLPSLGGFTEALRQVEDGWRVLNTTSPATCALPAEATREVQGPTPPQAVAERESAPVEREGTPARDPPAAPVRAEASPPNPGALDFIDGFGRLAAPDLQGPRPRRRGSAIRKLVKLLEQAGMDPRATPEAKARWLTTRCGDLADAMPGVVKALRAEAEASRADVVMLLAKFAALAPRPAPARALDGR